MRALRGAIGLGLLVVAACSEGTPVAPQGAILRVSAFPTRISKQGVSTITVSAYRSTGNPVNPGTEVRLSSTLGRVDPVVYTNDSGQAIGHPARRRPGRDRDRHAPSPAASSRCTIDIAVGQLAASMSFQVTPSSVAETGGRSISWPSSATTSRSRSPDAQVNFRSEVGTLASGGRFITTDADGEARDALTVTAADLQLVGDDNFEVTAEVGGAGGSIISRSFQVGIQRAAAGVLHLPARRPRRHLQRHVDRQSDQLASGTSATARPTSNQQNPVHTYSAPGTYVVTLTARNSIGTSSASNLVQITN